MPVLSKTNGFNTLIKEELEIVEQDLPIDGKNFKDNYNQIMNIRDCLRAISSSLQ